MPKAPITPLDTEIEAELEKQKEIKQASGHGLRKCFGARLDDLQLCWLAEYKSANGELIRIVRENNQSTKLCDPARLLSLRRLRGAVPGPRTRSSSSAGLEKFSRYNPNAGRPGRVRGASRPSICAGRLAPHFETQ
jgi:hypothetical protein